VHTGRGAVVLLALSLGTGFAAAACSSAPGPQGAATSTTRPPLPAGALPSEVSKMVCATKTQSELANVLGVAPQQPVDPTWADHQYTCRFAYSNGALVLTVKELSSWGETKSYFHALGSRLGDTGALTGLGQGAFTTQNGSVVARKDWKVLLVDISGLPAQFGVPATSSADVANTVADIVMGCWSGD
jgi:hypothetical protein